LGADVKVATSAANFDAVISGAFTAAGNVTVGACQIFGETIADGGTQTPIEVTRSARQREKCDPQEKLQPIDIASLGPTTQAAMEDRNYLQRPSKHDMAPCPEKLAPVPYEHRRGRFVDAIATRKFPAGRSTRRVTCTGVA
jgi:hypothetical protein